MHQYNILGIFKYFYSIDISGVSMKYVLFIALIILFSTIINAQPLNLNPSSININIPINVKQNIDLNIRNNNDFDVFNVTFLSISNMQFPFIPLILKNSTFQTFFNITAVDSNNFNFNSNISFDFKVNILSNSTDYNVDINSNGFSPSLLDIKQNDKVIFKNKDSVTITIVSEEFNTNIPPNQTSQHVFTQLKTLNVSENVFSNIMSITIRNNTEQALSQNSNFNSVLNIQGKGVLFNGSLSVIIPNSTFSAENNKIIETIIRVKNLGNITLEHVKLISSLSFIEFTENDFNLLANEDNALIIKIKPNLNRVEDTGKNYNLTITAKADNSNQSIGSMDIFIRLDVFASGSNINLNELVETLRRMLESALDVQSKTNIGVNGSRGGGNVTILITKEQYDSQIRNQERIADSAEVTNDFLRQTTDSFTTVNPKMDNLIQILNKYVEEQEKLKQETLDTNRDIAYAFVALGAIVLVLVSTFLIYKAYVKYKEGNIDEEI